MTARRILMEADLPVDENGQRYCYLDYVGRGYYAVFADEGCMGTPLVRTRTAEKMIDHLERADNTHVVIAPSVEIIWSLETSDSTEVWNEEALGGTLMKSGHASDDELVGDLLLDTVWSRRRGL